MGQKLIFNWIIIIYYIKIFK